jgi:hypothetical protein
MDYLLELLYAAIPLLGAWLAAITTLIMAVIGVALLIPGEEPEKTLTKVLEFLKKLSKKPEGE